MLKRDMVRIALTIAISLWGILSYYGTARADDTQPELKKMRVTCYLPTGNRTADGTVPYEGIVAARRQDLGKVAVIYDLDMNWLGNFEVRDTGGAKSLKNGTSIDVFRDDMDSAREWIRAYGDYCYVQLIEADG